jgi:cysteinyl-tRNA synthetase
MISLNQIKMQLKVKKLHSEAKLPKYATEGDAGMDLFSLEEVRVKPGDAARKEKDWATSDALRNELETLGFAVFDTVSGTKVTKKG